MIQEQEGQETESVEEGSQEEETLYTVEDAIAFLSSGRVDLELPVERIVAFLSERKFGHKTICTRVRSLERRLEYQGRLMAKVEYNRARMEEAVAVIEDVLAPRDRGSLKVAVARRLLQGTPTEALEILFTEHDVPMLETMEERVEALVEAMVK